MIPLTALEVKEIISKLYDKLLICLNDEKAKARLEKSMKSGAADNFSNLVSTVKRKNNDFKTRLSVLKSIKEKASKLYMKTSSTDEMYKQFLVFLKSKMKKEYDSMGVDGQNEINKIFQDELVGDKINLVNVNFK